MFQQGGTVNGVPWAWPKCFWFLFRRRSRISSGMSTARHLVHVFGSSASSTGTSIRFNPPCDLSLRRNRIFLNICFISSAFRIFRSMIARCLSFLAYVRVSLSSISSFRCRALSRTISRTSRCAVRRSVLQSPRFSGMRNPCRQSSVIVVSDDESPYGV